MIPTYDKVHQHFKINSISSNFDHLKDVAYSLVKEGEPFEREIGNFLLDWLDDHDHIMVTTSGSTGSPKKIKLMKQNMVNSAIATGDYFGIGPDATALLCLPVRYIAGKMMLVRAIILGLELETVAPTKQLDLHNAKPYDFCAMLPMQLQNNLNDLNKFKKIIVGGAPVSLELTKEIQSTRTKIYETYGMTETITHVAVKQLNNFNSKNPSTTFFQTLPNVTISQDERDCLVIEASHLFDDKIVTNDIVKIHSKTEFEWLGRFDNVINSGGIKLYPEQIEQKLAPYINKRFFIASKKDKQFGEALVLVYEDSNDSLDASVFKHLDKFEIPKHLYNLPSFSLTSSGKIQRDKTLSLLE